LCFLGVAGSVFRVHGLDRHSIERGALASFGRLSVALALSCRSFAWEQLLAVAGCLCRLTKSGKLIVIPQAVTYESRQDTLNGHCCYMVR
jgi:hypothetical protein